MKIEAPQIIMISMSAINFGIVASRHGEPEKGNYSVWNYLSCSLIIYPLLYWGGFFG